MREICIVPFTSLEYPMAINTPKDRYSLLHLVTPRGVLSDGLDISLMNNSSPTGICVTNSMEDAILSSELIIISQAPTKALHEYAYKALHFAAQSGKNIMCYLQINSDEMLEIENISKTTGAVCEYPLPFSEHLGYDEDVSVLHDFDIPIVFVQEIFPHSDGYDSFIGIATSLKERGYNVLAISENPYNTFWGYGYVKFDTPRPMKEQIYYLNELIYQLICKNHPDVVLIQPPFPASKFDSLLCFDGGVTSYAISQAIAGSCSVLCSPLVMPSYDEWRNLLFDLEIKQGFPVVGLHISNVLVDRHERKTDSVIHYPIETCFSEIDLLNLHSEIPFYNLSRPKDLRDIVELIIAKYVNMPYGVI